MTRCNVFIYIYGNRSENQTLLDICAVKIGKKGDSGE